MESKLLNFDYKIAIKKYYDNMHSTPKNIDLEYFKEQMYVSDLDPSKHVSKAYLKYKKEEHMDYAARLKYILGNLSDYENMGGFTNTKNNKPDKHMLQMLLSGVHYPRYYQERCPCKHPIVMQCYIRNKKTDEILIVGSCCIKKFNIKKLCPSCKTTEHKSPKNSLCNDCSKAKTSFKNNLKKITKNIIKQQKNNEKQYKKEKEEYMADKANRLWSIIRFGKYKGDSLYILLKDESYVQWIVKEWKMRPFGPFKPVIEYLIKFEKLEL